MTHKKSNFLKIKKKCQKNLYPLSKPPSLVLKNFGHLGGLDKGFYGITKKQNNENIKIRN